MLPGAPRSLKPAEKNGENAGRSRKRKAKQTRRKNSKDGKRRKSGSATQERPTEPEAEADPPALQSVFTPGCLGRDGDWLTYTTLNSETPRDIAAKLGCSVQVIIDTNKSEYPALRNTAKLLRGTVLWFPQELKLIDPSHPSRGSKLAPAGGGRKGRGKDRGQQAQQARGGFPATALHRGSWCAPRRAVTAGASWPCLVLTQFTAPTPPACVFALRRRNASNSAGQGRARTCPARPQAAHAYGEV